ncbi:hypothetical protein I6E50_01795 [Roseburia hominis]|uniref:hypothetical protein n=1 Tax=Roseburia hominis TaxID=301301 RepID=UPI001F3C6648|nr:hypothetical protein [Roseburia hominis]
MALTNNYDLNKPELDDKYDVRKFNENADIIDEELAKKATSTQSGRVKLSDSSAVTDSEGLALPATEKNASIKGTLANKIHGHIKEIVYGETGVHGIRYYAEQLQVKNDEGEWVDIESGGGGISPSNVSDLKIKVGNQKLTIFWSDPGNTIVEGQTLCTWKGTKLVQKAGSYPTSVKDGTLLLDNQTLDAYKTNGYEINGLTNGTTYYFALFPYADTGATNINEANRISGTPQPYVVFGVDINLADSNPSTWATYTDDAVGMEAESDEWDTKPLFCDIASYLFKDGAEVGKLMKGDPTKFEDGTTADITSGNAGDVMTKFTRGGLKMWTTGNILSIRITDNPEAEGYSYKAFKRGSVEKDCFYLGRYKGYVSGGKMRSLSGKTPATNQTIGTFRGYAHAMGSGYENSGYYQLLWRQALYAIKYKMQNAQVIIGKGYTRGSSVATTGQTNGKGDTYGTSSTTQQMILFGLEDFYGNIWECVDGLVTDASRNILTATDNFNDSGSGYDSFSSGVTSDIGNYLSKPQGNADTGFTAKEVNGSATTYFCDYSYLYASCVAMFGGYYSYVDHAGVFCFGVSHASSYSDAGVGGRLMFL